MYDPTNDLNNTVIELGNSGSNVGCLWKAQTVSDARLMHLPTDLVKGYSMDHLIKEGLFEFPSGAQADKVARLLTRLHFFEMLTGK